MSPETTNVVTDPAVGIIQIAEMNNVIRGHEANISRLKSEEDALVSEIEKHKVSKLEVEKEVASLAGELEKSKTALEKQKDHLNSSFDIRSEELNSREEAIAVKESELATLEAQIKEENAKLLEIREENRIAQETVDSKLEAVKKIKAQRENELAEIETRRMNADIECRRMEELAKSANQKHEENLTLEKRLKESEANATAMHESITAERQALEVVKANAIHENSSAEYNKGIAEHLILVFRNALHTYAQISGVSIRIPELTDEHKEWIAKDMLKQIGKTSISTIESETSPEGEGVASGEELVAIPVVGVAVDNPKEVTVNGPALVIPSETNETPMETTVETPETAPTAPIPSVPDTQATTTAEPLTNNQKKAILKLASVEYPSNANSAVLDSLLVGLPNLEVFEKAVRG